MRTFISIAWSGFFVLCSCAGERHALPGGGKGATPLRCDLMSPQAPQDARAPACLSFETCALDEASVPRCVELREERAEGDPCEYRDQCAAGLACLDAMGCRAWCRVGATDCDARTHCLPVRGAPHQDGAEMGFCAPASFAPTASPCSVDTACN